MKKAKSRWAYTFDGRVVIAARSFEDFKRRLSAYVLECNVGAPTSVLPGTAFEIVREDHKRQFALDKRR